MRWGVLEEPGIVDLFRTAEGASDPKNAICEFIGKILSIRTEFWNRGLQSDSLERAVPAAFREEVKRLLQKYRDAIALTDQKEGDLPNPIPHFETAKRVYDITYSINKRLYQILITAFSEKVDHLPESSGISATSGGNQSSGNGSSRAEIEQRDIGR